MTNYCDEIFEKIQYLANRIRQISNEDKIIVKEGNIKVIIKPSVITKYHNNEIIKLILNSSGKFNFSIYNIKKSNEIL